MWIDVERQVRWDDYLSHLHIKLNYVRSQVCYRENLWDKKNPLTTRGFKNEEHFYYGILRDNVILQELFFIVKIFPSWIQHLFVGHLSIPTIKRQSFVLEVSSLFFLPFFPKVFCLTHIRRRLRSRQLRWWLMRWVLLLLQTHWFLDCCLCFP